MSFPATNGQIYPKFSARGVGHIRLWPIEVIWFSELITDDNK